MDDLKEKLLSDVAELAKDGNENGEGFLKSLTNLVESEKYEKIADELAGISESEKGIPKHVPEEESESISENDLDDVFMMIKAVEASTKVESNKNTSSDNYANDGEAKQDTQVENKDKKKKHVFYTIMMIACLGVFLYCLGRIGVYYYTGWKYKQSMNTLSEVVGDISHKIITPAVKVITETDIYFPDEQVYASDTKITYTDEVSDSWSRKYASLVESNSDCVGWLQIPDTEINYPVMYTPNDVEKYLYRNFEGQYLFRGLPFMSEGTLLNRSQNYIIYGHNMNDGTAFNNLSKFLSYDFGMSEEHKYVYFNTAFSEGIYELMAVVITKVYTQEDECFKYYKYAGELSEDDFNTYVYYMKKMSSYDTGVTAEWGDQLLTLSTCFRVYDPEGRLVVLFRRVQ